MVRVISFYLDARNFGPSDVTLKDAYISGVDGTRLPLMVSTIGGGILIAGQSFVPIAKASAVPVEAEFSFGLQFGSVDGVSENEFLEKWARFTVVIIPDGAPTLIHEYTGDYVLSQLQRAHPERVPHILQKP